MIQKVSTLEDYEFGKTIGQGMFGKVKIGFHRITKQHVAIKILHKNKIFNKQEFDRVTRQIMLMKSINHPNVIKLYEIIETQKQIYLIMEYADHGDLMTYIISKNRLEQSEAAIYLYKIAKGIQYIHSLGIAHRDLKPGNILLARNNQIKIADFGLSNIYKPGGRLNTSCGSPCYAAPQVIQGKAYQPINADIWSMGIVLYIMVSGFLPFHHKNTQILYKIIFSGQYDKIANISQQCALLIQKILQVQVCKRIKIRQIIQCNWIKKFNKDITQQELKYHNNNKELNIQVLKVMKKLQVNHEEIVQEIQKNRHNRLTTIYYLLCNKTKDQLDNFDLQITNNVPIDLTPLKIKNKSKDRKIFQRTPRSEQIGRQNQQKHKKIQSNEQRFFLQGTYLKINQANNNLSKSLYYQDNQQKKHIINNKPDKKLSLNLNFVHNSLNLSRRSSIPHKINLINRCTFIKKYTGEQIDFYQGPYNLDSVYCIELTLLKQKIKKFMSHSKIAIVQTNNIIKLVSKNYSNIQIIINRLSISDQVYLVRINNHQNQQMLNIFHRLILFLNQ